jgi:CxxC motif-containing protein
MNKEIICIVCPLGCRMEVALEGTEVKTVTGNQCKKGVKHAEKEVTFPGRVLTTTMKTDIPEIPLLPVRSNKEVPKNQLITCMKEISKQHVSSPIKIGEIVMKDILGLGVDITACRSIP